MLNETNELPSICDDKYIKHLDRLFYICEATVAIRSLRNNKLSDVDHDNK